MTPPAGRSISPARIFSARLPRAPGRGRSPENGESEGGRPSRSALGDRPSVIGRDPLVSDRNRRGGVDEPPADGPGEVEPAGEAEGGGPVGGFVLDERRQDDRAEEG